MARNVIFDFRLGGGSASQILYGTVSMRPTTVHAVGTSLVLPAKSVWDLVDGKATATNVAPSPDPVEGSVEWAYEVEVQDNRGRTYSWLVGVPDSTTPINFNTLPRYFETKPPLFGQGPRGIPGEAATVDVGTVTGGATAQVNNSGTNTDAVLDFVLPEGPQGPPGTGVNLLSDGVRIEADPPSAWGVGVSVMQVGSVQYGWPSNHGIVTCEKRFTTGRAVLTFANSRGIVWQRTGTFSGDTWNPFKEIASADLATTTADGLMSSADKSKLDNVGTLAYRAKTPSNEPSTYPSGSTVGLMAVSDGWPEPEGNISGSVIVRTDKPLGYGSATQWVSGHKVNDTSLVPTATVMYREGATTGTWGEWQTLATEAMARKISGVVDASEYTTVQEAVDVAFETKRPLLVDEDIIATAVDYKFFQLQTVGKGSITVGGNQFWVNPQHQGIQTNRLYINPTTGNDLASGIDPNAPIKTFNRLNIYMTMLREKLLDGFWEVIIQAGVHTIPQGWRMDGLRTKWPLVIKGEGTLNTIIDGGLDTQGKFIYFKHFQTSVTIQNILVRNYRGEGADGEGIDTHAGILVQGPGNIRIEDCRFVDVTTAVSIGYAASGAVLRSSFQGDLPRSTSSSMHSGIVCLYGASVTIGTLGNANTFINCYQGVHVTRNAVAHVDYNTHQNCYLGLLVSHNARGAVLGGNFWGNMVGIDMTGGGECTFATADFGVGSTLNIDHNVRFSGSSRFTQFQGQYPATNEYRLYTSVNVPPIVGDPVTGRSTLAILPSSNNVPKDMLYGMNKKIRFVTKGVVTGTGSRKHIWRKSDRTGGTPTDIATVTIPSGYTGAYSWEAEVYKSAVTGDFRVINTVNVNGQPPIVTTEYFPGVDMSHDWLFRLYKEDAVAGLTTQIITYEIFVSG